MGNEREFSDEEIENRVKSALRRALNTPHKPAKEMVGTTERAQAQRES